VLLAELTHTTCVSLSHTQRLTPKTCIYSKPYQPGSSTADYSPCSFLSQQGGCVNQLATSVVDNAPLTLTCAGLAPNTPAANGLFGPNSSCPPLPYAYRTLSLSLLLMVCTYSSFIVHFSAYSAFVGKRYAACNDATPLTNCNLLQHCFYLPTTCMIHQSNQ
jgi:hypothetical protein